MIQDSPRIAELRRRLHADSASTAFAQLAEEYRRAGSYTEAAETCRAGLQRHPTYVSARVTLGRALLELADLEGAQREFDTVLRSAPENLSALRGSAEAHRRGKNMAGALLVLRQALVLSPTDSELQATIARIEGELRESEHAEPCVERTSHPLQDFICPTTPEEPVVRAVPQTAAPAAARELMDFEGSQLTPLVQGATQETSDNAGDLREDLRIDADWVGRESSEDEAGRATLTFDDHLLADELELWLDAIDHRRRQIREPEP